MNTITRASLFGGTLLAAGIAANDAQAAEFIVGDNFNNFGIVSGAYAYAYRLDVGGGFAFDSITGPASGNTNITASVTGDTGASNTASVLLNETTLAGNAAKSDGSSGFVFFDTETDFLVDADVTVQIDWAADLAISGANRIFQIIDTDANTVIFDYQAEADPALGSTSLALSAGTNYQLIATLRSLSGNGGASFSVLIPAPGAIGLAGVAGIAAARRRR